MSNTYARIQYKKCKVFNDGKGGRMTKESNKNNKVVTCCLGAKTEPTEWGDICEECKSCPKWINNIIGGNDNE